MTTSLLFALICLTASVGLVQLSGFVPTTGEKAVKPQPAVTILAIGGACLIIGLSIVAVALAIKDLGWAPAVVIAGITFLIAPLLLQPLPVRIKDSALGIVIFIVCASIALGLGITETRGL